MFRKELWFQTRERREFINTVQLDEFIEYFNLKFDHGPSTENIGEFLKTY